MLQQMEIEEGERMPPSPWLTWAKNRKKWLATAVVGATALVALVGLLVGTQISKGERKTLALAFHWVKIHFWTLCRRCQRRKLEHLDPDWTLLGDLQQWASGEDQIVSEWELFWHTREGHRCLRCRGLPR